MSFYTVRYYTANYSRASARDLEWVLWSCPVFQGGIAVVNLKIHTLTQSVSMKMCAGLSEGRSYLHIKERLFSALSARPCDCTGHTHTHTNLWRTESSNKWWHTTFYLADTKNQTLMPNEVWNGVKLSSQQHSCGFLTQPTPLCK